MTFATRLTLLLALASAPAFLAAQEHAGTPPVASEQEHAAATAEENADFITPHITDSYWMERPMLTPPFAKEVCVGRRVSEHECLPLWEPVHIGGLTLQLSPTKHVVMMLVAATLCAVILIGAARGHARSHGRIGRSEGLGTGIEAMVLYIRNTVIMPNVGHHGDAYVPFLLAAFFFILFCNLLGLIPFGATATGNFSVTATMAIISFIVVEISGMRALGAKYFSTIFYWNKDLHPIMRVIMFAIMTPVEIFGKFTKPFALAIRLFANMTAGHIVVLAFIGLIFTFKSLASGAPFIMAIGIMLLEIFVSVLQAFIFTLLSAVFIGQIRSAHH
jgi:F-type H+-transporting ATPase subunit a